MNYFCNKAGYTAIRCVLARTDSSFGQKLDFGLVSTRVWPTDGRTDGRTDRPTDGRTDTPSYRDARTHLKSYANLLNKICHQIIMIIYWYYYYCDLLSGHKISSRHFSLFPIPSSSSHFFLIFSSFAHCKFQFKQAQKFSPWRTLQCIFTSIWTQRIQQHEHLHLHV